MWPLWFHRLTKSLDSWKLVNLSKSLIKTLKLEFFFYHFLPCWQNCGLTLLPIRPVAVFWYPENGHPSLFPVGQKGEEDFSAENVATLHTFRNYSSGIPTSLQGKYWILSSSIFWICTCCAVFTLTRVLFSEYPIKGNNVPISTLIKATTFQPHNLPIICDIFHLLIIPLIRNFFGK